MSDFSDTNPILPSVVLDHMTEAFFVYDLNWRFVYVNHQAEVLFKPRAELIGNILWDVYPHLIGSETEKTYRQAMESKVPVTFDVRSRLSPRWYSIRGYPSSEGLAVFVVDVTLLKESEKTLSDTRNLLEQIAVASPTLTAVVDLIEGKPIYESRHISTLMGYTPDERFIGGADVLIEQMHPDDVKEFLAHRERVKVASDNHINAVEFRVRHRDGNWRWIRFKTINFKREGDSGNHLGLVTIEDFTERKQIEERLALQVAQIQVFNEALERQGTELKIANELLEHLAETDGLTGLHNHRSFQEELRESWDNRHNAPMSLIFIDVDEFKEYNDRFGHPAGDDVLRAIAGLLKATCRKCDFIARYGGEEFAVILPGVGCDEAIDLAEQCRLAIAHAPWPNRRITVSVGVECSEFVNTPSELVVAADRELYHAKDFGRNQVSGRKVHSV